MILVRDVFQAKYGKGNDLVSLFKEAEKQWGKQAWGNHSRRLLTDLSGPFFTVVTEIEIESLADWEQMLKTAFSDPSFGGWFERMTALVESGRREFYTIVG
ncbi:MAG: hypothetical protein HW416_1636 [Chloroflexi bacterium]|nr:hypothetical protein [Chloroflexota bacterium]